MFGIGIDRIRRNFAKLPLLLIGRWRQIAYYTGVFIVLCAVAWAAEGYRVKNQTMEIAQSAAEAAAVAEEELPGIIVPEQMRLLRAYDGEAAWNGELCQWENHRAQDYASEDASIFAFADGEIITISKDSCWGNYMEVASGELLLRYASVAADEKLRAGDAVKAGERIGTADQSMLRERYLDGHLHLEAVYGDETVDPAQFDRGDDKAASNS